MSGTLRVKNWERFQHYKDRNPPWIKLHTALCDDYAFTSLSDVDKCHLMLIWVLASKRDGLIPCDGPWVAARIAAQEPVNLPLLVERGFLEPVDGEPPAPRSFKRSKVLHTAEQAATHTPPTEERREEERRGEERQMVSGTDDDGCPFPFATDALAAYQGFRRAHANPSAFDASLRAIGPGGIREAGTWEAIGQALAQMAGNGERWNEARLRGYLRRDADPPPPRVASGTGVGDFEAVVERLRREGH